jgi:hypothetical protein
MDEDCQCLALTTVSHCGDSTTRVRSGSSSLASSDGESEGEPGIASDGRQVRGVPDRGCRRNPFADLWTYVVQDVIRGVVLNVHLPVARSAEGSLQPGPSLILVALDPAPTIPRLQTGLRSWRRVRSCFPAQEVVDPDTGLVSPAIVGDVVVCTARMSLPVPHVAQVGRHYRRTYRKYARFSSFSFFLPPPGPGC